LVVIAFILQRSANRTEKKYIQKFKDSQKAKIDSSTNFE
jgi:hypothetical protein